jgi:hypothetical protein
MAHAEETVDIMSRFTYCWGGSEKLTHNADGSITYSSKEWGGMVAWVGDEDWTEYTMLVFELAEPSPCAVQPLVLYPDGVASDLHYMEAGTTKAFVELSENKRQHVTQVAFQTSKPATVVITRIYLVKVPLQDYGEQKGQLHINELMQSNIDCTMDDLNDFPDSWVELYNSGATPVNLRRYKLGLTSDADAAWQLPIQTVEAGQYVVVCCDKVGKKLHTDYRLDSGKGGSVYLFFDGEVDDKRENIEKQPAPNISLGYKSETDLTWGYQYQPTPGAANCGVLCAKKQLLGQPVFSEKGRVLTGAATLHLQLSPPEGSPDGTVMRYTLDGSEPTASSPVYATPLTISNTTTVRAKAFCDGYLSARSATQSYIFLGRDMTLPVVSLVTDQRYWNDARVGIIANNTSEKRTDWRRPVNIEYFDAPDSDCKINQLGETRVQGGASRGATLKSLAVYANKRFGEKRLSYEFFPDQRPGDTEFKSLLLRNAGNDFDYLLMRDAVIQRTMAQHVDLDWQAWRPAIVFKNGVYKGILNIRERSNEDNIYTHYDKLEDIDMFENWGELKEGDYQNINRFKAFYQEKGHTLEEYEQWMDCGEFANLMLMNLYYSNRDFPGNNIVLWRPRAEGGRWRFIAKDTDFGLGLYDHPYNYNTIAWLNDHNYHNGSNNWATGENETMLFRHLMEDEAFRKMFLDRAAVYMGDFLNERGTRAVWDPMVEMIRQEFPYHKKAVKGWINYDEELDKARHWVAGRTNVFYQQLADFYHCGSPTVLTVNKELPSDKLSGVTISINDIPLSQPVFDGKFFSGREVTLDATADGQSVTGWQIVQVLHDGSQSERVVDSKRHTFTMPSCKSLTVNALFDTSGIRTLLVSDLHSGAWYTLDGQKLDGRPTAKGVYILNGKKIVMK